MNNAVVTQNLSPAVGKAVARLYDVFGGYRAPTDILNVCLDCCMDEALELEMRRMPLRQISARHFYEYNSSAKDVPQPGDEIKYLLPRMLELIAQGFEVHHSLELAMDRLGNCETGVFSVEEREAITAFALAHFSECLRGHPWQSGAYGRKTAFEVLLMFDIGTVDLKPLLDCWLQDDRVAATLHYVCSGFYDFWSKGRIGNAFAKDRSQFQAAIKAWLIDENHRRVFARRILSLDTDELGQPSICYYGSQITPKEMAEAVFDLITY